jgi:hypothetical protein
VTYPRPLFVADDRSPFLLLEADASTGAEMSGGWRDAALTVRTVRGRKMRTVEGVFDEMAAALQFPYYFGENWDAFDECLSDMDWMPMDAGVVVVVSEPGEVLVDAGGAELGVLVRTIVRAGSVYSRPIETGEWWDRPAVPFHVVLQSSPFHAAAVRARWRAAGAVIPASM